MKTILKYEIPIIMVPMSLDLPMGSQIRSVGHQTSDSLVIWVEAHDDMPPEKRRFRIVGTGQEIPDDVLDYIGTVQIGGYVWHLYELETS